jgi:glucan 1,3-beta-glucosidase
MFFHKKYKTSWNPSTPPLRGVNLGGWLVLEKWITPSLFRGLAANDEYTLCSTPSPGIRGMITAHRDTFVTREDFVWLRKEGIDAVRLPVGYWTFGGVEPYSGTIGYVDKAFAWAEETGLKILLDMHAAPGSQNGWDHSGHAGDCGWQRDEQNVIQTLEVVGQLARRYGKHPQLLGIELLNEPKWTVPKSVLLRYYTAAYKMIRQECSPDIWIVISDNFRPRRWKRPLRGNGFANVFIDTHQYQTFNKKDKQLNITGHLRKTAGKVPKILASMRRYHPLIVGEWSIALDPLSLAGLDQSQIEAARRAYGATQLLTYSRSSAWFYWTYRTEDGGAWSYRDCITHGWLPAEAAIGAGPNAAHG